MSSITPIFSINVRAIEDGDMSGDITSDSIDIGEILCVAVHSFWTGTPAGNILVQASNDNSNWVTVDTQAAGGAAGNDMVNIERAGYKYLRVMYDATSSTGTLNTYVSGKRI